MMIGDVLLYLVELYNTAFTILSPQLCPSDQKCLKNKLLCVCACVFKKKEILKLKY